MKLYYFNPNDYGEEYFVTSDSPENALQALKNHFKSRNAREERIKDLLRDEVPQEEIELELNSTYAQESLKSFQKMYDEDFKEWEHITLNTLPDKYTLDVFEPNIVVRTEIC